MGFSFGFAAGGLGQGAMAGFNSARQMALEQAHFKMQQQQMQWQQQKFEEQQDTKPVDEMINRMPYAAGTLLPLREEARGYSKNPGAYSYQPQAKVPNASVPSLVDDEQGAQQAIAANMLREQPVAAPPALHGPEAWHARLGDAGEAAAQTDLDRQTMMLRNAIEKSRSMIDYRSTTGMRDFGDKQTVLDNHLPGRAAATAEAVGPAKIATAEGVAKATAPIKVQTATDIINATGPGKANAARQSKIATGGLTENGLKPIDSKTREGLTALVTLRDKMASIQAGTESGDLPMTGGALSKANSFGEKAGGLIPGLSGDDPRLSAYYKFIEEMRLDREKAKGGVRMAASPIMLDRTNRIFANPGNSPKGFAARIRTTVADLDKTIEDELQGLRASGMDDSEIRALASQRHLLAPEQMMGGEKGGGAPRGIFSLTGTNPFPAKKKQPAMPKTFQPDGGMPPSFIPE